MPKGRTLVNDFKLMVYREFKRQANPKYYYIKIIAYFKEILYSVPLKAMLSKAFRIKCFINQLMH